MVKIYGDTKTQRKERPKPVPVIVPVPEIVIPEVPIVLPPVAKYTPVPSNHPIQNYVNSDTAVILGTGSSINKITEAQWSELQSYDLWAVNNWVYHPTVVPRFYHMEVKYDEKLMSRRIAEKWDKYKNVLWLVEYGRSNVINTIGHANEARILLYSSAKSSTGKYGKTSTAQFVRSHNSSITLVFDMVYKLGYKNVILGGVDLWNSKYFWTGNDPIYGDVHIQFNKQNNGDKKTMNMPHKVYAIKEYIIELNNLMKSEGREIFIINKDTELHRGLRIWK